MSELRDLLHERHGQMAASLRDADEFSASSATRAVRRKRRGRAAAMGSGVLAAVGVMATGAWLLLGPAETPVEPVVTPSPSVAASATPSPGPSASATASATAAPTSEPSPSGTATVAAPVYTVETECAWLTPAMVAAALEPDAGYVAEPGWAFVSYDGTGGCGVAVSVDGQSEPSGHVEAHVDLTHCVEFYGSDGAVNGEELNPISMCTGDLDVQVSFTHDDALDAALDQYALVQSVTSAAEQSWQHVRGADLTYDPALPELTVDGTSYRALDLSCTADQDGGPFTAAVTYGTPERPFTLRLDADSPEAPAVIQAQRDGDLLYDDPFAFYGDAPPTYATHPEAVSVEGATISLAAADWFEWTWYDGFTGAAAFSTEPLAVTCATVATMPDWFIR